MDNQTLFSVQYEIILSPYIKFQRMTLKSDNMLIIINRIQAVVNAIAFDHFDWDQWPQISFSGSLCGQFQSVSYSFHSDLSLFLSFYTSFDFIRLSPYYLQWSNRIECIIQFSDQLITTGKQGPCLFWFVYFLVVYQSTIVC